MSGIIKKYNIYEDVGGVSLKFIKEFECDEGGAEYLGTQGYVLERIE